MSLEFFNQQIQARIDADRERCKKGGYEFRKRTVKTPNWGDVIYSILDIDNDADALAYYLGYVEWIIRHPSDSKESPESIAKANIGWCYGEGMTADRRDMWIRVCQAVHPVFGTMTPTAEEAFKAGLEMGSKS